MEVLARVRSEGVVWRLGEVTVGGRGWGDRWLVVLGLSNRGIAPVLAVLTIRWKREPVDEKLMGGPI